MYDCTGINCIMVNISLNLTHNEVCLSLLKHLQNLSTTDVLVVTKTNKNMQY